jgi:PucR C-terminal helix-turn-helix domain
MDVADVIAGLAAHSVVSFRPQSSSSEITSVSVVDAERPRLEHDPAAAVVISADDPERAQAAMHAVLSAGPSLVVVGYSGPDLVARWYLKAAQDHIALVVLDDAVSVPTVVDLLTDILSPVRDAVTGADVQSGDLFALAEAFADMMEAPTILEDENFRVLAYSSVIGSMDQGRQDAILGRRMPEEWRDHLTRTGALSRLRTSTDIIDVVDGPANARRRLLTSVWMGTRMLGVIWVAQGDTPLPVDAATRLRRIARHAVPHYLTHERQHREDQQRRGLLVAQLLSGTAPTASAVAEIGLAAGASTAVCSFVSATGRPITDRAWARLADHVALSFETYGWPTATARTPSTIHAIVDIGQGSPDDLIRLGEQICKRAASMSSGGLRGCASQVWTGFERIAQQRSEADDAVAILLEDGGGPTGRSFAGFDELRPQLLVRRVLLDLAADSTWRLPGLQTLERADASRNSQLVRTLRHFIDYDGNVSAAARALQIHPTTLRYRMEQIAKLTGADFTDATVRLAFSLSIRAFAPTER